MQQGRIKGDAYHEQYSFVPESIRTYSKISMVPISFCGGRTFLL